MTDDLAYQPNDTTALFQILYYSTAQPPNAGKTMPEILKAITVTAQRYNNENGVTGALLYCDGWFMQWLEGSEAAVKKTFFDHIVHDTRHRDPHVMESSLIQEREFADWSMASLAVPPEELTHTGLVRGRTRFNPALLSTQAAVALLHIVASPRMSGVSTLA